MYTMSLAISGTSIRQDSNGRFCLNDLHKSAGGEKLHQPSNWLRMQQTIDLISVLESEECKTKPLEVINGGNNRGTFVVKELVYAYATWISAKFFLSVIRAYDSLVSKPAYALIDLASINTAQRGVLSAIVSEIATSSGKEGTTKVALWSRFSTHFKLNGFKELPAIKFDEAKSYLENLRAEYDRGFTLAVVKKDDLQTLGYDNETKMFALRALPNEKQPTSTWQNHATMILTSHEDATYTIQYHKGISVIMKQPENVMIGTPENIIRDLTAMGYHVVKDNPENKLETIVKIAGFVA